MKIRIIFADHRISDMIVEFPSAPSIGDSIEFPFECVKYTNGDTCYDSSFTVVSVSYKMKISENGKSFEHDIIEIFIRTTQLF